ncbi:hypothetical protein B0H13DRAFT_2373174 [Mycena leptocephala]|nr:hypothetical protein B0H13DRAFT_2373174 [Mycena leptocephala]
MLGIGKLKSSEECSLYPHLRSDIIESLRKSRTSRTRLLCIATPRNTVIDLTLSSSPPSRAHRRRHSSSPEIVVKSEPATLSYLPEPAITSVDADTDDRWARGQVFVLSGFGTWPAGVYAQDMVWAFGRISSGRASDSDVESRFESAFPGVPYVKATYARQLQFYRKPVPGGTGLRCNPSSQSRRPLDRELDFLTQPNESSFVPYTTFEYLLGLCVRLEFGEWGGVS